MKPSPLNRGVHIIVWRRKALPRNGHISSFETNPYPLTPNSQELAGSRIMGQDQHWELLPAQAGMCLRVGANVQGFQAFPTFPQWLGKHSTTGRHRRLTQEIVQHSALSIGQVGGRDG